MPRPDTQTYFLCVIEQRVGGNGAGPAVGAAVYANLHGDAELVRLAAGKVVRQMDPDRVYEVLLFGHDRPFGECTDKIIHETGVGSRLAELLAEKAASLQVYTPPAAGAAAEPGE